MYLLISVKSEALSPQKEPQPQINNKRQQFDMYEESASFLVRLVLLLLNRFFAVLVVCIYAEDGSVIGFLAHPKVVKHKLRGSETSPLSYVLTAVR